MVVKLKRSWKSCLFQTLAPQRKDLSDPRPSSSSPLCRGINSHYRFLFSCRPLLFGPGEAVLSSALSSPCLVIQPYQEARNVLTLKNGHTAFWGRDGVGGSSLPHPLTGRRCPAGPGDGAVGVPPPGLGICPVPCNRRDAGLVPVSVSCSQFLSPPDLPRSDSIFVINYLMARGHSAELRLPISTCVLFPTFLRPGLPLAQVGSAMHRARLSSRDQFSVSDTFIQHARTCRSPLPTFSQLTTFLPMARHPLRLCGFYSCPH